MENVNQENNPTSSNNSTLMYKVIIFLLMAIIIATTAILIGIFIGKSQNNQDSSSVSKTLNTPTSTITASVSNVLTETPQPSKTISTGWEKAKFGGIFTYDYPEKWHVAELWSDNYVKNGVFIAMDPKPISTAPRGGPLSTFGITVLNGNNNPDEILNKKMSEFSDANYSDIVKETLTSSVGTIYHYKGKVKGEMMLGAPVEHYYLTFKMSSDLSNQQVIIGSMSLVEDQKLSEMFKHVMMSIKKVQN